MEKDQIFILKDRGLAYICGPDAENFLQNIVTNDINKVSDAFSCFASLLTKRFPVEDPAKSFTPQHPSRVLTEASSFRLSGVAPK